MRRTGMQFTLRLIMVVVAFAGFIFAGLAWFLQSKAPDAHVHDAFIQIGPYLFWSTSPASWAILGLYWPLSGDYWLGSSRLSSPRRRRSDAESPAKPESSINR